MADGADQYPVASARDAILRYLSERPKASDTASGIHRWWLNADPRWDLNVVTTALEHLVQDELLEALSALDGRVRYRMRVDTTRAEN